jgi:hypothetical protein
MEGEWLKLYVKAAHAGWTSHLPLDLYGAWCKLLQVIKEHGVDGNVTVTDVTDLLLRVNVTQKHLQMILDAAGDNIVCNDEILTIVNWAQYQDRPELKSAAERQKRWREKHRTSHRNVTTVTRNAEENRIEENRREEGKAAAPPASPPVPDLDCELILIEYNRLCPQAGLPKALLTDGRKKKLQARWKEPVFRESYATVFATAAESKFLTGHNDRKWRADFGWLVENPENYVKVLEGKYSETPPKAEKPILPKGLILTEKPDGNG